ncbi:Aste57867_572 [Aphanomyces stellatus]|uniref:Kinetochore protein NDC80 n=1 Tax=Aphanomyces stellatus TaxID=120398 RepID=A0A485K5L8_9STRA|nr:hypothetical protein As57867_000571 [Aphanomyces stellatus]VFT77797.1 Aste57867_572 [Aphanomyces stellatus]
MTDPRPIGERNFMQMCIRLLIEFLSDRHYDHPLSQQLLYKPMKKDFVNIMQFLFRQLDPNFLFSTKIEEDVGNCFRTLKYPFPISKTALAAVGTLHSWPPLLAAISWLIELLTYDSIVQEEGGDDADDNGDKEMFEYLTVAYKAFLSGNDDEYDLMTRKMEESFDAQNRKIQQETDVVQRENDDLRRQIEELETGQSLPSLNNKKRDYTHDRDKLKALVQKLEINKEKYHDSIRMMEQKLARAHHEYEAYQAKAAELQHRIDTQELSADDLERMQRERARLQELLATVDARFKGIQASHWQKETAISEQMDRVEEAVKEYMTLCRRLKLDEKHGSGIDFGISIDAHSGGAQAATALMLHLKKTIVPGLQHFRRQRIERLDRVLDRVVEAKVMTGQATSEMNDAVEAARGIDGQERKLEEAIRKEQEAMDAALELKSREIEEMELELERLQNDDDVSTGVGKAEKLLREARAAYAEMTEQYEREIDSRLRFIQHAIAMCIAFKERVVSQLGDAERAVRRMDE